MRQERGRTRRVTSPGKSGRGAGKEGMRGFPGQPDELRGRARPRWAPGARWQPHQAARALPRQGPALLTVRPRASPLPRAPQPHGPRPTPRAPQPSRSPALSKLGPPDSTRRPPPTQALLAPPLIAPPRRSRIPGLIGCSQSRSVRRLVWGRRRRRGGTAGLGDSRNAAPSVPDSRG